MSEWNLYDYGAWLLPSGEKLRVRLSTSHVKVAQEYLKEHDGVNVKDEPSFRYNAPVVKKRISD